MARFSDLPPEILLYIPKYFLNEPDKIYPVLEGTGETTVHNYRRVLNLADSCHYQGLDPPMDDDYHLGEWSHEYSYHISLRSRSMSITDNTIFPRGQIDIVGLAPGLKHFACNFNNFNYRKQGCIIKQFVQSLPVDHRGTLRSVSLTYKIFVDGSGIYDDSRRTGIVGDWRLCPNLKRLELALPFVFTSDELKFVHKPGFPDQGLIRAPEERHLVQFGTPYADSSKSRLIDTLPQSIEELRFTACGDESAAARLNLAVIELMRAKSQSSPR